MLISRCIENLGRLLPSGSRPSEQEVDDGRIIGLLDESTNDAERSESQVLEGTSLGSRVEERV